VVAGAVSQRGKRTLHQTRLMQMRLSGRGAGEGGKRQRKRDGEEWIGAGQRKVGTTRFIQSHNFQILNFHVKMHPNHMIARLGPDLLWKLKRSPIPPSHSGLQGKGTSLSSRIKGRFSRGREGEGKKRKCG
jgi:hypothetical protein